jgi:UDP-glucose 4-epimerase
MQKILITGATGFVGCALCQHLVTQKINIKISITAVVRKYNHSLPVSVQQIKIDDLTANIDWLSLLKDIDCIIHLAGRAHIVKECITDPLAAFRQVNTQATLHLATQAAKQGVRRFIFLSSIKVNGEETQLHQPFQVTDKIAPLDPYGISKYEAEQGLQEIAVNSALELVIIRPPLIYGENVKANFLKMMQWVQRGIPLPLGAVKNKRSLLALDNLLDFITLCIHHPKADNQIFLLSDDHDLSTIELLRALATSLEKPLILLPVPVSLLLKGAEVFGKRGQLARLCGSLQIDLSHTKKQLAWKPTITTDNAVQKTVESFLKKTS